MVVPFFRMLFYGIIFSILMTFIIGFSTGVFELVHEFPYVARSSYSPWIPITFVSFSFLFAFVGYLSNLQLKEDILSPMRQKLVGIWEVRAQTWKIDRTEIVQEDVVTHCTIGIEDVGKKLILHFDVTNSDIFADQSLDITNVMIAFVGEPKKLIYFQDNELTLKQPIGEGADRITTARFPFLGVLNVSSRNDQVNEMIGVWYDIDNSVLNLARRIPDLRGMDELVHQVEMGSITFKGALTFRRIDRPAGTRVTTG
ncbi:MAG: hypothetical protein DI543_04720 [Bradyrhizobium icense]|nr:MAG: hypothetical protein DI543_04720 [Bradyrhizobium icense]